jgi:hypothetical protein
MGVDNDYINHEINDIINYFNAPDSKFTEISEYEYSPEIISFLVENVSEFDIETFSVDINKPITRSITAESIKTIRSILDDENSISNSLSSTQGINTLLQAIILVRSSYSNKKLIGLFQHIYQYIEHTTFRIMGIQETTFDEIKEKRKVGKPQKGGNNVIEPTLVAPPLVEPKLSFEPKEQTVFNIPIKNNVEVDNIQNVLNAIIDDTVINDNIKDMKSEEIYHALNMIGDDNDINQLNHLQFVNKTIHQIVKEVYTFFLQREYTNKYSILNSHYLKQILMKYVLIILYYQESNKYEFIKDFSGKFIKNIDIMLNEMCPLPIKSHKGFGKKKIGGGIEDELIRIDPNLKTMTVKRNQLINRLNKLERQKEKLPSETSRRYISVQSKNDGIQSQIESQIQNFNEDVNRYFEKQSEITGTDKRPSPEIKSVINMLCSEVAYNGLLNMGISDVNSNVNYPDGSDSNGNPNNTIFNNQVFIINGISNGYFSVSGIDDKLLEYIINNPGVWDTGNGNYQQLPPVNFISTLKNKKISIINNAIKKSRYPNFLNNTVCSTPQYIDAMGGLGSCTMKQIKTTNNEFPSVIDIYIQTNTPNYYRSFIKHENNRVILEFDYNIDNIKSVSYHEKFSLKDGKELLSASNTMDALSTKIMYLWNSRYNQDKTQSNAGIFQDLFKENFNQLISIASRKGKGDRAQEENSVFINGGYRNAVNYNNNNIRIGAMGDRPSGFRAMLDMKYLTPNSVRPKTIAGYFGPNMTYAIYSPGVYGAGKTLKKQTRRKNKIEKQKKQTKRRSN